MSKFFGGKAADGWDGALILRDIVDSWRADNNASGLPVYAHRPLPSRFATALADQLIALPSPDRDVALNGLLAKSAPGVKLHVKQQLDQPLLESGAQNSPNAELIARTNRLDAGLRSEDPGSGQGDHSSKRNLVGDGDGPALDEFLGRLRDVPTRESQPSTFPYDPERDRGRAIPLQQEFHDPWMASQFLPPEERAEFIRGMNEGARAAAHFLGRALYELSPLAPASEFVQAVRRGDYAEAAIAVLMTLPMFRGLRVGHHIIARTAWRHAGLRKMMRDFGVDLRDTDNVAQMMEDSHRVLHTRNYYEIVAAQMRSLRNADEMRAVLRNIRKQLEGFRYRTDSRREFPPLKPPKH